MSNPWSSWIHLCMERAWTCTDLARHLCVCLTYNHSPRHVVGRRVSGQNPLHQFPAIKSLTSPQQVGKFPVSSSYRLHCMPSHLIASSPARCRVVRPPGNLDRGQSFTIWLIVCFADIKAKMHQIQFRLGDTSAKRQRTYFLKKR